MGKGENDGNQTFRIFHNDLHPFKSKFPLFIFIHIVVCKCFQFRQVYNFLIWWRVKWIVKFPYDIIIIRYIMTLTGRKFMICLWKPQKSFRFVCDPITGAHWSWRHRGGGEMSVNCSVNLESKPNLIIIGELVMNKPPFIARRTIEINATINIWHRFSLLY